LIATRDLTVLLRQALAVMMQARIVRGVNTVRTVPPETLTGVHGRIVPLRQARAAMMQAEIARRAASTLRIARVGPMAQIVRVEILIGTQDLPVLLRQDLVAMTGVQDRTVPLRQARAAMMQAEIVRHAASTLLRIARVGPMT